MGPPAAQVGAVEHVVVDQRRRVHELDRRGGAQHAGVLGRRVPGGEEDQQRPQALAPGGDGIAGVLGEQLAVARGQLGEPALQPRHELGDVPAPGGDHGGHGLGGGHHATSPTWIAMIPPAVTIQRTERRPQRSMVAASARPSGKRFTELGRYV